MDEMGEEQRGGELGALVKGAKKMRWRKEMDGPWCVIWCCHQLSQIALWDCWLPVC